MATAFAHDVPDTTHPLARAAGKLARVAANGTAQIAQAIGREDDATLIADLRERGMVGPIDAGFLASYRQGREFQQLARSLDTVPDGANRFRRALVRVGLMPSADPTDAKLLAAWDRWKAAVARIEDSEGDLATYEQDVRARDAEEDLILEEAASTPAGAAVKLRFALDMGNAAAWVSRAIVAGDDTTLFARADELPSEQRAIVDALALLVRPADTTVRDAFDAWVAAQHAWEVSLKQPGPNNDALQAEAERLETALAATPARSAEDMLFKLLPLARNDHSSNKGPFALDWTPESAVPATFDGQAWYGLISDMLALSPRIAEVVAMPQPPRSAEVAE